MDGEPRIRQAIAERVRDFWHAHGASPRGGLSAEDIAAVETRLSVSLPADIVRFFRTVNGTEGTCGDLFEAWSLDRVGAVPEVLAEHGGAPDYRRISQTLPNAAEYFVFADAMIWSQVLAVRVARGATTEVVWISGSSFASVAPSFETFWERYLAKPDTVVWAVGASIQSSAG